MEFDYRRAYEELEEAINGRDFMRKDTLREAHAKALRSVQRTREFADAAWERLKKHEPGIKVADIEKTSEPS